MTIFYIVSRIIAGPFELLRKQPLAELDLEQQCDDRDLEPVDRPEPYMVGPCYKWRQPVIRKRDLARNPTTPDR